MNHSYAPNGIIACNNPHCTHYHPDHGQDCGFCSEEALARLAIDDNYYAALNQSLISPTTDLYVSAADLLEYAQASMMRAYKQSEASRYLTFEEYREAISIEKAQKESIAFSTHSFNV